jgi:MraZ protein
VVLAPRTRSSGRAADGRDLTPADTTSSLGTPLVVSNLSWKRAELKRFFFNASFDTELDAANRVMIPTTLMEYAGLTKEVVVTGSGECLEVWDRARYAHNFEDVLTRIPDITASLGNTA